MLKQKIAGHTPGAWDWHQDKGEQPFVQKYNKGFSGPPVAYISRERGEDEARANARLIASAPELLETMKMVFATVTHDGQRPHIELTTNEINAVLKAIDKAEGR